jgi:hypothetical protein
VVSDAGEGVEVGGGRLRGWRLRRKRRSVVIIAGSGTDDIFRGRHRSSPCFGSPICVRGWVARVAEPL